uniref:Uncharacterized protein n=1 Tax=Lepeophtheirus salmonis TaxID=72036 RepID=A0A0K2TTY9_LEPSM
MFCGLISKCATFLS